MNNMKKLYMNLLSQGFDMTNLVNENQCYKRLIRHSLYDHEYSYDNNNIRVLKDLVLYKSEKEQFWYFPYVYKVDRIIDYITFDGTNGETKFPINISEVDEYERICKLLIGYKFKNSIPLYVEDIFEVPLEDLDDDESRYYPMCSYELYDRISFDHVNSIYSIYADKDCNIVIVLTQDEKCLVNYYIDPECGFTLDMLNNVYKVR